MIFHSYVSLPEGSPISLRLAPVRWTPFPNNPDSAAGPLHMKKLWLKWLPNVKLFKSCLEISWLWCFPPKSYSRCSKVQSWFPPKSSWNQTRRARRSGFSCSLASSHAPNCYWSHCLMWAAVNSGTIFWKAPKIQRLALQWCLPRIVNSSSTSSTGSSFKYIHVSNKLTAPIRSIGDMAAHLPGIDLKRSVWTTPGGCWW